MKIITFSLLTSILMFLSGCDHNKNIASSQENKTETISSSELEIVEFTSQYVVPGIESNLRGTKKYQITINTNFKDSTQINSLLVDSIVIPINYLQVNGKYKKSSTKLIGEYKGIVILVSRNIYSSLESHQENVPKQINYELSGHKIKPSEGALVYTTYKIDAASKTIFPLGPLTKKENLYRP